MTFDVFSIIPFKIFHNTLCGTTIQEEVTSFVALNMVNGSLLPALVISVYCAFVCYTGLSSEPRDYVCNGLNRSKVVTTGTLVLGMLTPVLSVLYSALPAGSSTCYVISICNHFDESIPFTCYVISICEPALYREFYVYGPLYPGYIFRSTAVVYAYYCL